MKVALLGRKYKNSLDKFIEEAKSILIDQKDITVIDSYFETSRDEDFTDKQAYKKIMGILYEADAVIIEATKRSEGIGFIEGLAFSLRKPILILYNKTDSSREVSSILTAVAKESDRVIATQYDDKDLKKILVQFVKRLPKLLKSRFFVEMKGEDFKYLEWYSHFYGVPKAELIRDLLGKSRREDNEWQNFTNTK